MTFFYFKGDHIRLKRGLEFEFRLNKSYTGEIRIFILKRHSLFRYVNVGYGDCPIAIKSGSEEKGVEKIFRLDEDILVNGCYLYMDDERSINVTFKSLSTDFVGTKTYFSMLLYKN